MYIILGLVFIVVYGLIVLYISWSGWSWIKPAAPCRAEVVGYHYAAGAVHVFQHITLISLSGIDK